MRDLKNNIYLVLEWSAEYKTVDNPEFDPEAEVGPTADPQKLVKENYLRRARVEKDRQVAERLAVVPNMDILKISIESPGKPLILEVLSTAKTDVILNEIPLN